MHRIACLLIVSSLGFACSSRGIDPATGEAGQAENAGVSSPAPGAGEETSAAETEPPRPQFREVTLPAGTSLAATLTTDIASDTSRAEDPVRATLAKPIVVDDVTVVPAGAELSGVVLEANGSGRVKGLASIAFRFDRLDVGNERHDIKTARITRQAKATKGEDAKKVGIGTGAGAIVGAIAGGGKGAAVGAAVGAGAGTGVVLATKGDEVRVAAGNTVTTTITEPVTILVPVS
jgi:hypothetical protein